MDGHRVESSKNQAYHAFLAWKRVTHDLTSKGPLIREQSPQAPTAPHTCNNGSEGQLNDAISSFNSESTLVHGDQDSAIK